MSFVHTLRIQSWTLYPVGIFLVACRLISRRMKLGSWWLQIEDWLMVIATICCTVVIASVNEIAVSGSNYMPPEVVETLTPHGIQEAIYGSKLTLVMEMCTLATEWLVKACLLFLYHRLTFAFQRQQLAIKLIAVYCAIGYIVLVSLLLGYWCRPIWEYWRVPVRYSQCTTYINHIIIATTWNISSDLMLLAIPIPFVIKTRLPRKKKIILCCILGVGVLNIIISILNRVYNLINPNELQYVYFYVAEVLTAIYVGNIPLCWPIVQRVFGKGAWAKSDDESDPNQPRSSSGKSPLRKRPFHHLLSGTITGLDQTNCDRMGDVDERTESREQPTSMERPVSESSKETIALTTSWHHNSNSTTILAGPSAGSTNGSMAREDGVGIVRTVEVSREERCEPVPAGVEVESTDRSSFTRDRNLRSDIV
ncbi:hypothetical protein GGR51DRAFT_389902 [Nemania sp. FL0031]|nr:hypothetical protein GGR51DRAFT_389902 [Nemania sp. FL0031]